MIIDKETFCNIIDRLQDYHDLQSQINDLFNNQIDNRELDFMNAGSICIGHESVVIELLEKMFETDTISWWIYEMDFGKCFSIGDLVEDNGEEPDLTTVEKLYDYLVKNIKKEV